MTSIVAFELIKNGELSLDDKFLVSEKAWRLAGSDVSSMFIMHNDEITVENLLKGIIIVSGNDACIALAEGIAGSEEEFALMMTAKAKEIGMNNTNFSNSTGLNAPDNVSTVSDILIMSNYLIKNYPEFYHYFKIKEFTWNRTDLNNTAITQPNTNNLLMKNKLVDGIKTGFLSYEKYSLASSLLKNDRRIIAVVSGFKSKSSRVRESNNILTWGINSFDTVEIAKKEKNITEIDVWHGNKDKVGAYVNKDIYKTIPKARKKYLKISIEYEGPIHAPIKLNQEIGKLKIFYKDKLLDEYVLFASENVKKLNFFSRLVISINFLIWGDV
jgi:D-alanyl-D-alanine carboxypeptidase (penicillin-binding protein 5/6)